MELFPRETASAPPAPGPDAPLADRMRPTTLEEFTGQRHLLAAGRPLGSAGVEGALIDEVAQAMRDASICGLGQTAANAVQSAIRKLGLFGPNGRGAA